MNIWKVSAQMISFYLKMPVNCVAISDYYRALLFFNALWFASDGIVLRRVEQFTNIEDHPFFLLPELKWSGFPKRPLVILQGLVALELCSVIYIMLCFPCSPEKRPPPHLDVNVGGRCSGGPWEVGPPPVKPDVWTAACVLWETRRLVSSWERTQPKDKPSL